MLLAALILALAAIPVAVSRPLAGGPVAVMFPPWVSAEEAVARGIASGALVLRGGRLAPVVILAPDANGVPLVRPDGALLVLALDGLGGCLDAAASGEPA